MPIVLFRGRLYAFLFYLVSLLLITADLQAAVINVPADYKTIQGAVDHSIPGDSIIVHDGKYKENIVITKALSIKANSFPDAVIVQPAASKDPVFKIIGVDGVSLIGFTVTGSAQAGIYIRNSKNLQISDNKTIKNESGIVVSLTKNSLLKNNITSNNQLYGIYLEASTENTVEKNTVEANQDKGIYLNASHNNSVQGNSVKLNHWNGIILWLSNNNTVKDNKVFRNGYGIVVAESNDNFLINNSNWPNFYLILPMLLAYLAIVLFFIEKKIFSLLEK